MLIIWAMKIWQPRSRLKKKNPPGYYYFNLLIFMDYHLMNFKWLDFSSIPLRDRNPQMPNTFSFSFLRTFLPPEHLRWKHHRGRAKHEWIMYVCIFHYFNCFCQNLYIARKLLTLCIIHPTSKIYQNERQKRRSPYRHHRNGHFKQLSSRSQIKLKSHPNSDIFSKQLSVSYPQVL